MLRMCAGTKRAVKNNNYESIEEMRLQLYGAAVAAANTLHFPYGTGVFQFSGAHFVCSLYFYSAGLIQTHIT